MQNNTNIKVPAKYADRIKSLDQTGNANYRVVFTDGNFEFATSQANILKAIREYLKPVEVEVVTEEPKVNTKLGMRVADFNRQSEAVKKDILVNHAKKEAAKKKLIYEVASLQRKRNVLRLHVMKAKGITGDRLEIKKNALKVFTTRLLVKNIYSDGRTTKELETYLPALRFEIAYTENQLNQLKEGK